MDFTCENHFVMLFESLCNGRCSVISQWGLSAPESEWPNFQHPSLQVLCRYIFITHCYLSLVACNNKIDTFILTFTASDCKYHPELWCDITCYFSLHPIVHNDLVELVYPRYCEFIYFSEIFNLHMQQFVLWVFIFAKRVVLYHHLLTKF